MADFVAVLRKTIDGLGDSTPAMREKVYEKARATVAAKLAAISPPPPSSIVDRQRRSLEEAIAQVENSFADIGEPADPLDSLQNIFPSLGANGGTRPGYSAQPVPAAPRRSWETAAPAVPAARPRVETAPVAAEPVPDLPRAASHGPVLAGDTFDPEDETDREQFEPAPRRRMSGTLIAAAVALVVVAGGGYGIWLNKDAFTSMLGMGGETVAVAPAEPTPPPAGGSDVPQPAAVDTAPAAGDQATKFTQRLNADGSEVDDGPAGGEASVGEGTSVAAVTTPATTTDTPLVPPAADAPPAAPAPATDAATTPPPPAETSAPPAAVAVAQKAIYYEERTNVAQGSADTGSIVWSVVQESPGGDLPPEPAIRANATIPAKNLQVTMTIRRNGDKTLPFSHMIELIFLTPDNFEGGGIENILRFALKNTEEAAGNSIIGTPAKIAEGFFLVALNDTPAEIQANLDMLRNQSWIDVPLIYKSGRRALITMEKGVPGGQVFDEVLKSWQGASAG